jgi:hypothetical protein
MGSQASVGILAQERIRQQGVVLSFLVALQLIGIK